MNEALKVTPHGILLMSQRILEERGRQRDQAGGERSIPAVVAAFNALTGHTMTEQQGWLFMALVKIKRSQTGQPDIDHYVDGAAYFALAGEAALATGKESLQVDAETARRELQDLLAHRQQQLGKASVYGLPDPAACGACAGTGNVAIDPANFVPCPTCAEPGTPYRIDATATRWHELQAMLRERQQREVAP